MSSAPLAEEILDIVSPETLEEQIREGFSFRVIDALGEFLEVNQLELAEALGVSRQTLARNIKQRGRLSPHISDLLYRVARISRRAVEVFEDKQVATSWLKTANATLGGKRPLSLLDTDAGAEKVFDLLGRIEHGVLS
ncbi:MAG: DUF2384 domain-containing protein [Bradymonadaceae bacterium]|nr:DUF2384 domain-containing protein [Lujinxingiaceae bacterium]